VGVARGDVHDVTHGRKRRAFLLLICRWLGLGTLSIVHRDLDGASVLARDEILRLVDNGCGEPVGRIHIAGHSSNNWGRVRAEDA